MEFAYSTVEEKAGDWGITPRYVQLLCRQDKIEGAIKRAGVWFIPQDATNPVKNTKADDQPFSFVGTKKKIFENSVKLFTQRGYENVSINDIANQTGIRQSAVYNHFKSKQEILDTIFDYFLHHNISNRPTYEDLELILKTEDRLSIITKGFIYAYEESILEIMSDIIKIIAQRVSMDNRAAEIFQTMLMEEGTNFIERGLNRAVEMGRLAPFDTHTIAVLINSVRLHTLFWWQINPPSDVYAKVLKNEQDMFEQIASLLTDLKPPN
ncbi:MAG: TetR/AcrR family transcriptional regulator [Coriobacteriia bacterium]|nr:TetR/AcrR family transcriptional regulator [Coriobacteriia bacterium]